MNKAARIRELLAQGVRPKAITAEVDCSYQYVEVVRQRLAQGSVRVSDRNWLEKNRDRRNADQAARWRERCATEPGFRERHNAKCRAAKQRAKEAGQA